MNLYMLLLVLAAELGLIAAQGSSGFIARVEGSSCATVHSRIQESAATIMTPDQLMIWVSNPRRARLENRRPS
jgi:hypothetical protein